VDRTNLMERRFEIQARAVQENEQQELWVEGYAVRFNSPTVLFEFDGIEFKEQIATDAFIDAKMDDVIFNFNHSGRVYARTRNRTLQLTVDAQGLFIRARLDGTAEGRTLYDDIANGYIDRMSFRFTVSKESYDYAQHLWTVERVKRLYDVSAVDIPAYDDTSIEARKAFVLEADAQEKKRAADADLAKRKLMIKLKLGE
jgi:uncharacterized protein